MKLDGDDILPIKHKQQEKQQIVQQQNTKTTISTTINNKNLLSTTNNNKKLPQRSPTSAEVKEKRKAALPEPNFQGYLLNFCIKIRLTKKTAI